jgi:mannosyltransferase
MTALRPETEKTLAPPALPSRLRARWAALGALLRRSTAARAMAFGIAGALVGWAGVGTPSYWGDEAASVMSAERTLPGLLALAGHVDAVHTTYYLFLHGWIRVFGDSELATRTPSAIAIGFLVAAVVVLGERLGGIRLGAAAAVVAILLPRDTYMAEDARSYAFASAAAAWIMVLALHLLRGRHRRMAWLVLGAVIGVTSWMFLYTVLLVPVIGVLVLVLRRDQVRSWLWTALAAAVVTAPIALVAYHERHQIAFLAHRDVVGIGGVLVTQWFIKPWPAVIGWALIVAAVALTLRRRRDPRVLVVAGAWMVLPTALLLLGDLVTPLYTTRYPSFCTPAIALLIGLGVVRIAESVRGRTVRLVAGAAVLGTVVAVMAPVYLQQRGPFGQANGSDFQQTAEEVGDLAHPGDAVVFGEDIKASLDPRLTLRLYPRYFAGLRDVELATPFDERTGLWDTVRPLDTVRSQLGREVIAVEMPLHGLTPPDITQLIGDGYRVTASHHVNLETVYRLVRRGA